MIRPPAMSMTDHRWLLAAAWSLLGIACSVHIDGGRTDAKPRRHVAVVVELQGDLPWVDTGILPLRGAGLSVERLESTMRKAGNDKAVAEILLHLYPLDIGWAKALRIAQIARAAAKKHPVSCLLEEPDHRTYYLAVSACTRIYAAPAGGLNLVGLAVESVYFKDLLDSVGIQADVLAQGKFKSAGEPLVRNDMSPDARTAMRALLTSVQDHLVAAISTGRSLPEKRVRRLLGEGPFSPALAKRHGLVDDVLSLSDWIAIQDRKGREVTDTYGEKEPTPMGLSDLMALFSGKPKERKHGAYIALITAEGAIFSGRRTPTLLDGADEGVYDGTLVSALHRARRDENIRGVVLLIDSPGGSALASDNIWQAVRALRARKPVVAVMGDVAASGGYYIASAADAIVAAPATVTGSIGVVGGKVAVAELLRRFGAHPDGVYLTDRAGMMSPFRPWTQEERAAVQDRMHDMYTLFLKRVATGRDMPPQAVDAVAQGRVWSGVQARHRKLVDKLGSLDEALHMVRARIGRSLPLRPYPPPQDLWNALASTLLGDAQTRMLDRVTGRATAYARTLATLLHGETVIAMMPFLWQVR